MTDEWFKENTFELIIDKKFLTKKVMEAFDKEKIYYDEFDPMYKMLKNVKQGLAKNRVLFCINFIYEISPLRSRWVSALFHLLLKYKFFIFEFITKSLHTKTHLLCKFLRAHENSHFLRKFFRALTLVFRIYNRNQRL